MNMLRILFEVPDIYVCARQFSTYRGYPPRHLTTAERTDRTDSKKIQENQLNHLGHRAT